MKFFIDFMNGLASAADIDAHIETWHTSNSTLPLHVYLGMSEQAYADWVRDPSSLWQHKKGAPLTVIEARVILRADEALALTYDARLATGTTFSDEEREAWIALVASANDRIIAWEGTQRKEAIPAEPDRYPGGNEPDFQTLSLEAVITGAGRAPSLAEIEARDLRRGIETIVSVFGTNSAEWAQQFRGLLDRVPVSRRST